MQEPSLSCGALKRVRTGHRETQNLIRDMWDSRCLKTSKWKCLINTWVLQSEPEIKMGRSRQLHGNRSHQPGSELGGKAAFIVCVEKRTQQRVLRKIIQRGLIKNRKGRCCRDREKKVFRKEEVIHCTKCCQKFKKEWGPKNGSLTL